MIKNPPANAGDTRDLGSISRLGRSPGGGNGNLLQYSCLENSMDRGAWWARGPWCHKEVNTTEHTCACIPSVHPSIPLSFHLCYACSHYYVTHFISRSGKPWALQNLFKI